MQCHRSSMYSQSSACVTTRTAVWSNLTPLTQEHLPFTTPPPFIIHQAHSITSKSKWDNYDFCTHPYGWPPVPELARDERALAVGAVT